MKRTLALLLILALLSGCGGGTIPPPPENSVSDPGSLSAPPDDEASEPEEPEKPADPVEVLLKELSLEEKVGQLFFARCPAENAVKDLTDYHLGGFLLFSQDTRDKTASDLIQTIAGYQQAAAEDTGIPLLIGVDEEGKTVVRISSNPHLRDKKFSNPKKLWEAGMEAIDSETREKSLLLKALGINVNLAPVADVSTNPSDFMYDRTTGRDAETAGLYVARVVDMHSRYGLGSVLKHFPGYGNNKDTHTGIAVDERPLETFRTQDFLPFQAGMEAGIQAGLPPAVLVSHNIVSCMDAALPASLSPEVHRILREDLGFEGVVMTDDLAMDAVEAYAEDGSAAVMALVAGNDLLITSDYKSQIPSVIDAVGLGTLDEAVIDAACARVLRWKLELGLLAPTEGGALTTHVSSVP